MFRFSTRSLTIYYWHGGAQRFWDPLFTILSRFTSNFSTHRRIHLYSTVIPEHQSYNTAVRSHNVHTGVNSALFHSSHLRHFPAISTSPEHHPVINCREDDGNGARNNAGSGIAFTAIGVVFTRDSAGGDVGTLRSVKNASISVRDSQHDTVYPPEVGLNGIPSTAPGRINIEIRELVEHLEIPYSAYQSKVRKEGRETRAYITGIIQIPRRGAPGTVSGECSESTHQSPTNCKTQPRCTCPPTHFAESGPAPLRLQRSHQSRPFRSVR